MSTVSRNIIAVALFILIVGGLIFYGVSNKQTNMVPDGTVGTTASNLANGGIFAESDSLVFFANPYNDNCLYAMNPDGTDVRRISNLAAKSINVAGDKVFFFGERAEVTTGLGSVAGKPGIFVINSDGKHLSQLTSVVANDMMLIGNNLYYTHVEPNTETFDVFDLKTKKNRELLPHGVSSYSYTPDTFYYGGRGDNLFLYAFDRFNGFEEEIWEGIVYNPIYSDGYIYYMDVMNDYRLCRYSLSGNTIQILTDDRLDFFNLYGSVIFYQKSSQQSPALKRINIDGTGEEIIAEGIFNRVSLTSNYAYFTEFGHSTPMYRTSTFGSPYVTEFTEAKEAALEVIRSQSGKKNEDE
ncbi:MAG: DUF5050 domain-containing protein [Lachnospiraceae bacterium]|nr:DUF5050 domain-containing protein [Lachnospiraceae bacterium]